MAQEKGTGEKENTEVRVDSAAKGFSKAGR